MQLRIQRTVDIARFYSDGLQKLPLPSELERCGRSAHFELQNFARRQGGARLEFEQVLWILEKRRIRFWLFTRIRRESANDKAKFDYQSWKFNEMHRNRCLTCAEKIRNYVLIVCATGTGTMVAPLRNRSHFSERQFRSRRYPLEANSSAFCNKKHPVSTILMLYDSSSRLREHNTTLNFRKKAKTQRSNRRRSSLQTARNPEHSLIAPNALSLTQFEFLTRRWSLTALELPFCLVRPPSVSSANRFHGTFCPG